MKRRVSSLALIGVGVVFVVVALVNNLFSVGPAFERMTNGFRPQMSSANISTLQQSLTGMSGLPAEFNSKAVPQLASAMHMTPEALTTMMQTKYPAVAQGLTALPQIGSQFGGVLSTLNAEQSRFVLADAIPTKSLPATTVPWMILVAGILAIAVGIGTLRRGRVAATLAVTLGVLLVAGPLVMSLPQKSSAADTMNAHLKPVYTTQMVAGAQQSIGLLTMMGTQMQSAMTDFGTALNMTPAQMQAYMTQSFPTIGAALTQMPAILARFSTTVNAFAANIDNYNTAKPVKLAPITWTLLAGGIVIAGFGLVLMWDGMQSSTVDTLQPQEDEKEHRFFHKAS